MHSISLFSDGLLTIDLLFFVFFVQWQQFSFSFGYCSSRPFRSSGLVRKSSSDVLKLDVCGSGHPDIKAAI